MQIAVGVWVALALVVAACDRRPKAAPDASAIPWQPHGLRVPRSHCEFDVPTGWTRSPSPMPGHIAELTSGMPPSVIIIDERVEPDVATARSVALAYFSDASGPRATTISDGPLEGARVSGHVLSMRRGKPNEGDVETVSLLGFPDLPVIEAIARHAETNTAARDAAAGLVRSMRCTK